MLHVALAALDEAGDPMRCRDVIEAAIAGGTAPELAVRPPQRKQQVTWAVRQLAAHVAGNDPARAYRALRELLGALFEPVAGSTAARSPVSGLPDAGEPALRSAPAPEVALTMPAARLLDVLAPPPRVVPAELARGTTAELADPDPVRRVLAIRALRKPSLAKVAQQIAAIIACDPIAYVRAEATALAASANEATRGKLAGALGEYLEHEQGETRAAAIDAIRALRASLDENQLASRLHDPVPIVRAAALQTILGGQHAPTVDAAVLAALRDPDPVVCYAALGAVARYTKLHGPVLVEPLRAVALREDGDPRAAIYLLGKLGDASALQAAVTCGRSDVAHAAELVLQQLGETAHALTADERIARAARELASDDPDARRAGLLEARRLEARALLPAIRALTGEPLAREILGALGEPIPDARPLDHYRDQVPALRAIHGAYAVARAGDALGVWDHGTGTLLFAIEGAQILELVPGRAEAAVLRGWTFERYTIPTGERISSLAIPKDLTSGRPTSLAIAADLATIWCDHADAPYRFHIKLDPDRLLDDKPTPGRRTKRKTLRQ